MELRLDRLLADLRRQPEDILARIDADPLLLKRQSGDLILANASQKLYTPQEQHQLYAKGIVYRRDPYRLVSLPLIKIYNIGERDVTIGALAELAGEPGVRVRFLRKIDGSLIQVFRANERVYFTTRGMLEGARWRFDPEDEDREADFDYVAESRALAAARYPRLLQEDALLAGRTLLFELIHPKVPKVTGYGERADLILLGGFDHARFCYLPHEEVVRLGQTAGLTVVDALSPAGETLAEQVEALLVSWARTDEEGSVLHFERGGEVVYRVKVKSPEYLRLLKLMTACTYDKTVEILEAHPGWGSWADLEAFLREQGRERVPEEILGFYRAHYDTFQAYLADCDRLRRWAEERCTAIAARIGGREDRSPGEYRKAFATEAIRLPASGLVFAALDGRLDRERLRKSVRTPREARELLEEVAREGRTGCQPVPREGGLNSG
jgi:hypothetical protein